MGHGIEMLIAIVGAVAGALLWEAVLRGPWINFQTRRDRRHRWERLLDFQGEVYIQKSLVVTQTHGAQKAAWRDSDEKVEKKLEEVLRKHVPSARVVDTAPTFSVHRPTTHLCVIGSVRRNAHAEMLQRVYELSHEYVYERGLADKRPLLKIVSSHGEEYAASADLRPNEPGLAVDYGLLFVASAALRKRIVWISGIHGIGTMGVWKKLDDATDTFLRDSGAEHGTGLQWLFRVTYEPNSGEDRWDMIREVETIGGPYPCGLRPQTAKVKQLICDLGNVFMPFDRDRTYRAMAHLYNIPYRVLRERVETSGLRELYEMGSFGDQEFYQRVLAVLDDKQGLMTFENFSEWWGDIFWENADMSHALKAVRQVGDAPSVVLLSNTSALHFASVQEHYPDLLKLFDECILSYEHRVLKPSREIFSLALKCRGQVLAPGECLFIDDDETHVIAAREMGIPSIVYSSYPQLVFALRRAGLYVP